MIIMREYGSEFNYFENNEIIQKSWSKYSYCCFLRCGRDAVFAAAKNLFNKCKIKTVWIPALSCCSMYEGFEYFGYTVKYYPIDDKFNPLLDENVHYQNSAILFMLYYGVTDKNAIEQFINCHKECISILDISHAIWDEDTYNIDADILIGSIRKSVGVVNGGLFLSNKFSTDISDLPNRFTILRREAFIIKNAYSYNLNAESKQQYRKLLSEAELSLETEKGIYCADGFSIKTIMAINVKELHYKRLKNFNLLISLLKDNEIIRPLISTVNEGNTPFSLPVLVDNQDEIQQRLSTVGVYAPVLWPISEVAKGICAFSKKVSENMLSLPIDQRYSSEDIFTIAERVKQVTNEV